MSLNACTRKVQPRSWRCSIGGGVHGSGAVARQYRAIRCSTILLFLLRMFSLWPNPLMHARLTTLTFNPASCSFVATISRSTLVGSMQTCRLASVAFDTPNHSSSSCSPCGVFRTAFDFALPAASKMTSSLNLLTSIARTLRTESLFDLPRMRIYAHCDGARYRSDLQNYTDEGTYLNHVLKGTQSERCCHTRPHHLHDPLISWCLQNPRF